MAIDLRTSLPASAVAVVCLAVVVVRIVIAPEPKPRQLATEMQRREVADAIFVNETAWINETTQNFPRDYWSQRDDFHGREYKRAIELANERHLRIEDVLRAIDDDIHRRRSRHPDDPDFRNARAVPCKPRPVYD
jgi:hypothetical protein